jgi:uncharacterized membrane protein YdbT with pleckstrin-like domain
MAPPQAKKEHEQELWSDHPSHWTVAAVYAGLSFLALALIVLAFYTGTAWLLLMVLPCLGWLAWTYLKINTHVYFITSERLVTRHGVLTRYHEELELFRVKDIQMTQSVWMRPLNIGNVILITTDASNPKVTLNAISQPDHVRETLRDCVSAMRERKNLREIIVD